MSSVTSASIVLVVLFAVACDEPRSSPPPKTPATTIVVAPPADAAAPTKAMPPLPLPPSIEAPAPVACRFAVPDYRSKTELWLGPEGQFFAFADGARDLEVTFSDTNLESVGFSFNGGTFTFRVTAHAGDLTFHPKKGRIWGGYLIPHADMAMRHSRRRRHRWSRLARPCGGLLVTDTTEWCELEVVMRMYAVATLLLVACTDDAVKRPVGSVPDSDASSPGSPTDPGAASGSVRREQLGPVCPEGGVCPEGQVCARFEAIDPTLAEPHCTTLGQECEPVTCASTRYCSVGTSFPVTVLCSTDKPPSKPQ